MTLKKLKVLSYALLSLLLLIALWVQFFPASVYNTSIELMRMRAGLDKHELTIDNIKVPYYRGGEGPVIVMLHGFGGGKEHWLMPTVNLKGYEFIIPDIPGFGETDWPDNKQKPEFSIKLQTRRIHQMLGELGIKRIHLAGYSMGGNIASAFARDYPDMVESLYLVAPAGVLEAEPSEFFKDYEKNRRNALIVEDLASFSLMMSFVFNEPPWLPPSLEDFYANKAAKRAPLNHELFDQLVDTAYSQTEVLSTLDSPVLVNWGDADRILSIDGARIVEAMNRENIKVTIFPNLSHGLIFTQTNELMTDYQKFLSSLN